MTIRNSTLNDKYAIEILYNKHINIEECKVDCNCSARNKTSDTLVVQAVTKFTKIIFKSA